VRCLLVWAALMAAGCGSSGGSNVDAWLGNWMEGGTQSTTCAGVSTTTQLSMLVVFSAGPKAGTIQSSADNCALVWDVSGDKATLESGQTCTATVDGVNASVSWTASTLTLNGNTMTGTLGGSGNNCPFTQQATLTKM
jgi:hypothetical protein